MFSLAGWEKQKEQDRTGITPLFKEKDWKKTEISRKKEKEKNVNWFRGAKSEHDFPIFCTCTPDSKLLHLVEEHSRRSEKK